MKDFRTLDEAARELGRHPELVRRWIKERPRPRLRGEKLAGRWFIARAELTRFRQAQPERRKKVK